MALIVPAQRKSRLAQVYYFLDTDRRTATRVEVDVTAGVAHVDPRCWGREVPPLGLSPAGWRLFCVGPHSVTSLSAGRLQVGLRAFPRFSTSISTRVKPSFARRSMMATSCRAQIGSILLPARFGSLRGGLRTWSGGSRSRARRCSSACGARIRCARE